MTREFLGNIKGPKGDKGDSRTYGGGINLLPESDSRRVVKDEDRNFVVLISDGLPAGSYVISFDYEIVNEAEDVTSFLLYQGSTVALIPLERVDGRARMEISISESQEGSPLYLYGNRNAATSRPNEVVFKEIMIEHGSVSSLSYTPSELPPGKELETVGANLIPLTPGAWESGSFWSTGTENNSSRGLRTKGYIDTIPGERYTFSDSSLYTSAISQAQIAHWDGDTRLGVVSYVSRGEKRTFVAQGDRLRIGLAPMDGFGILARYFDSSDGRISMKLEKGPVNTETYPIFKHYDKEFRRNFVDYDQQYLVPGDFENLQNAVDVVSKFKTANGAVKEILMEAGYRPSRGISVSDGNYNDIIIRSEDSTVTVATNYSGVFLECSNASAPVIDCLIDAQDRGGNGFHFSDSSSGVINSGCGVMNAGDTGVYATGSRLTAAGAIFRGANNRAIWITGGSSAAVNNADASGVKGGEVALYASRGAVVNASRIDVSHANVTLAAAYAVRSVLNLIDSDLSYSARRGLHVGQSSIVSCRNVNISNAATDAVHAHLGGNINLHGVCDLSSAGAHAINARGGGIVSGSTVNASGAGERAVFATRGSTVSIEKLDGNRSYGIRAENGSTISLGAESTLNSATQSAVWVEGGSTVSIDGVSILQPATHGIRAEGNSRVSANGVTITDAGADGISTAELSSVSARDATITGSSLWDLRVTRGSQIAARNTTLTNGTVPQTGNISVDAYDTLSRHGAIFS